MRRFVLGWKVLGYARRFRGEIVNIHLINQAFSDFPTLFSKSGRFLSLWVEEIKEDY